MLAVYHLGLTISVRSIGTVIAKIQKVLIVGVWLVGSLVIGSNLLFAAHYDGRIYPGVRVGTLDLGGMDRNQASVALRRQISEYRINLQIDSKTYQLHPSEIGASYQINPTLDAAMAAGRDQILPLLGLLTRRSLSVLNYAYSLDKTRMQTYVEKVIAEQAEAPTDAAVVINDGKPVVQPDKPGLGVETEALVLLLQQGVDSQLPAVQVQRTPVQADVKVAAADRSAKAAEEIMATKLTMTYSNKQFTPKPADIAGWLTFTKSEDATLAVGVDTEKVKVYLATVAASVDVAATNKQVNVVNGVVRTEEGGQDGLAVDRDALAEQIANNLLAKIGRDIAIPTVKVTYKTLYNRTYELGSGKYVEINLTTQRMWAYFNHQVVYESAVTSGATGHGFATVQGLFSIYSKQTNRYLDGRQSPFPYYVHVDYWMPFYGGYGLHDASWRSQFGGPDYYWNGSHGCVNLPSGVAAWLYGFVDVGTPVWVHS